MQNNKVKNIERIDILTNVCINKDIPKKEFYTCLVVAMENNKQLVYNLTNGLDYSFERYKKLSIQEDKIIIYNFYESEFREEDYEIEFYELESIKLLKNIKLKKINTNKLSLKTNLIEFKDIKNNKFYISYLTNELYINKNNYEIINKNNTHIYNLYQKNNYIEIDFKIFEKED